MIIIPNLRKWVSSGLSDTFGSLWSSFNFDPISNPGKTRTSPRLLLTTDNLTGQGSGSAFANFIRAYNATAYYWMTSGKFVWKANVNNGYITAFDKDTITLTPTGGADSTSCDDTQSDMVVYGGFSETGTFLIVTTKTNVYYLQSSLDTWNAIGVSTLSANNAHMMCVYGSRIYITDLNLQVRSTTTAFGTPTTTGSYWLNLLNGGLQVTAITSIRTVSDGIWVFTINEHENGCWAFKWDGVTATDPNAKYLIKDASGVMASIIINDSPWVIDSNGRLMYFNGGTFIEATNGRLPIKNSKTLKNTFSAVNDRWIHPNGITLVDGRINILINNEYEDNGGTIEENIASGIWEYDPTIGWYHKHSLSYYLATGGSIADYGQNRIVTAGPLYAAKTAATSSTADGTLLASAAYYSDATTTKYGVFTNNSKDTVQKYGYFVTTKIYSKNIEDTWQRVYERNKPLLDSADSIVVKCRFNDVAPSEFTITWTDTNTFTSTGDLSAYSIGDEVEILAGKGGGKCAHITAISANAGTYTVDLDDTFTGASSGTAKARLQKWKKLLTQTSQTRKWKDKEMGNKETWVQFKVCMQFTGKDELEDLTVVNTPNKKPE